MFLNSLYPDKYNNGSEHSDLTFYLRQNIKRPPNTVVAVRLDSFVFPVSWTNVSEFSNLLTVGVDGAGDADFQIPVGEYSYDTLLTALNTLLNDDDITVTYNELNWTYTFTHATADFVVSSDSTCLRVLGFEENEDHSSSSSVLTSDRIINLTGHTNCLYFDLKNLSINNTNGVEGERTSVLTCVPVRASTGEYSFYENYKDSYVYLKEDVISTIQVRILNEDLSNLVNFNGANWTATLEFSFIPK